METPKQPLPKQLLPATTEIFGAEVLPDFEVAPPGEWWDDRDLGEWLGVSPSQIRAARKHGDAIWSSCAVRISRNVIRYHGPTLKQRLMALIVDGGEL